MTTRRAPQLLSVFFSVLGILRLPQNKRHVYNFSPTVNIDRRKAVLSPTFRLSSTQQRRHSLKSLNLYLYDITSTHYRIIIDLGLCYATPSRRFVSRTPNFQGSIHDPTVGSSTTPRSGHLRPHGRVIYDPTVGSSTTPRSGHLRHHGRFVLV